LIPFVLSLSKHDRNQLVQHFLREHNIAISTLSGGCLRCRVKGSLTPLLKNLRMDWESKANKPFDSIFIETNCVANLEP